jgi:flagellar biosynthetic protein FliP
MKRFLWHYVEMIIAMAVGMLVLGVARAGLLGLLDVELSSTTQPELAALLMAFDMSVGMVVWMRYRGHGWASTMEMVAVMFAPVVLLAPFTLAGLMSGHALMMVMHIAMLPLMLAVMLRRRAEYSVSHAAHAREEVAR